MNTTLLMTAAKSLSHQQLLDLFEMAYKAYKNNPSPYTFLSMSEAFTVITYKRAIDDGVGEQLSEEIKLRSNLADQYKGFGNSNTN